MSNNRKNGFTVQIYKSVFAFYFIPQVSILVYIRPWFQHPSTVTPAIRVSQTIEFKLSEKGAISSVLESTIEIDPSLSMDNQTSIFTTVSDRVFQHS